jgi:hypothetical protein
MTDEHTPEQETPDSLMRPAPDSSAEAESSTSEVVVVDDASVSIVPRRPVTVGTQPGIVGEIWGFLRVRKKFWLAPIILSLMLLAGLFWLASSAGVISPFIYAL